MGKVNHPVVSVFVRIICSQLNLCICILLELSSIYHLELMSATSPGPAASLCTEEVRIYIATLAVSRSFLLKPTYLIPHTHGTKVHISIKD